MNKVFRFSFQEIEQLAEKNSADYKQIEWNNIIPDNNQNVRSIEKYTSDSDLHELAFSIIQFGLRQPIILYRSEKSKKYHIWHGQRRYSAIRIIQTEDSLDYYVDGKKYLIGSDDRKNTFKVPCLILPRPKDETQRILRQIAENENRKEIDNLELCEQYHKLLFENAHWNQEVLALHLGKSKQLISDICGLKRIKPKLQKLIREIQLYGFTMNKFNEYSRAEREEYKSVIKFKKIGIIPLRKIACSDNQEDIFWKIFYSRCSKKDAVDLGINLADYQDSPKTDLQKLNLDYYRYTKKLESSEKDNEQEYLEKRKDIALNIIKKLLSENNISMKEFK